MALGPVKLTGTLAQNHTSPQPRSCKYSLRVFHSLRAISSDNRWYFCALWIVFKSLRKALVQCSVATARAALRICAWTGRLRLRGGIEKRRECKRDVQCSKKGSIHVCTRGCMQVYQHVCSINVNTYSASTAARPRFRNIHSPPPACCRPSARLLPSLRARLYVGCAGAIFGRKICFVQTFLDRNVG